MQEVIIKDKNGNPIFEGQKFKFKFLRELHEPRVELTGSFSWNNDELRYEIDVFDHEDKACLSYISNGVMSDFELIDLYVPNDNTDWNETMAKWGDLRTKLERIQTKILENHLLNLEIHACISVVSSHICCLNQDLANKRIDSMNKLIEASCLIYLS